MIKTVDNRKSIYKAIADYTYILEKDYVCDLHPDVQKELRKFLSQAMTEAWSVGFQNALDN